MGNEELDIAAMIGKLMSDPTALEMVKKLKEESTRTVGDSNPEGAYAADATGSGTDTTPDMLQKLPEVMSALAPVIGGTVKNGGDTNKRNQLLAALKPYLSENRQGMIDKIVSLSRLTSLVDLLPDSKNN